jgi:RNA polymerase sigma-70 factor (ECF subfamily)
LSDELAEHVPALYRFALSLTGDAWTAEDLVQEAMLRAVDRLAGGAAIARKRSWLFTVARNLWRDQRRQHRRRPAHQPLHLCDPPASPRTPLNPESREELKDILMRFGQLPERQREVMYLRAVEQLTIDEIAAITKSTPGSVKTNLSLARRRLRQYLPVPGQPTTRE